MNFSRTPDLNALVFAPAELRPGTTVTVTTSFVRLYETTWNSEEEISVAVSGIAYDTSVKAEWPIPQENLDIQSSGLFSLVTVEPIFKGDIDLKVYYRLHQTDMVAAVSAISETDATYYNDWFKDQYDNVVPMTVVPLNLLESTTEYKLEDFDVHFDQSNRGISVLNGDVWISTSVGTLKVLEAVDDFSLSRNLFRKGLTQVSVPLSCSIEPVIRYNFINGVRVSKVVEIELQEWDGPQLDCRGILWHRDKLYIMTNNGMYRFDRWGSFAHPDKHFPDITGNDLTYVIGDLFAVTEGNHVRLYRPRHDYVNLNRQNDTILMREVNSEMRIG